MTLRRWWVLALIAAGGALVLWWWPTHEAIEPSASRNPASVTSPPGPPPVKPARRFVVAGRDPISGRVGAGLNAIDGSAQRDLVILQDVLAAWRSNAAGTGNPVGDNQEITAALTGQNRWGFAIIPPDHPAINAAGELCDRWGTPLFFHQLSGERMEIVSRGPDRVKGTADDLKVAP